MHLHGPVDHLQRHARGHDLDHRDLGLRGLVAGHVHDPRGLQGQQASHVDLATRLRNPLARHALLGHGAAEGDPRRRTLAHEFERALGQTDEAHAVVDAPRPEAALRDFEAAAFAEQDAARRHAHVVEADFHVTVRRVVVAEHRQRPQHLDAGRIGRHQDHRLLRVARRLRVGLAHEDVDLAARIAGTADPPLAAVDDVVVAVTLDARGDVGRVARRDRRLGHREGAADLAVQQRLKPALLVFGQAVAFDRLHVAGVGRRAVEDLRAPGDAPHDLGQWRVVAVRETEVAAVVGRAFAAGGRRQEQVPEADCTCLGLERLDRRERCPALARRRVRGDLGVVLGLGRVDVLVHELQQLGLKFDGAG